MRKLHLPMSIVEHPVAKKLGEYIASMGPSSLYDDGQTKKFLSKDKDFPFVEFDWLMYCVMRTHAKTWVTSGSNLRHEPDMYGKDRGTFDKKELVKLYEDNVQGRLNLVVFTKNMKQKDIREIVSEQHFNLIPMEEIAPTEPTLQNIIENLKSHQMGPSIVENGVTTLKVALEEAEKKGWSLLDMMILSVFQGDMPSRYIGGNFITKWLEQNMEVVYESPKFETKVKKIGDAQHLATLKFVVFLKKQGKL